MKVLNVLQLSAAFANLSCAAAVHSGCAAGVFEHTSASHLKGLRSVLKIKQDVG